jgi:hypothetical protein
MLSGEAAAGSDCIVWLSRSTHLEDHHMNAKNASSTEPAKLLLFMIAPHGAQLKTYLH